MCTKFSGFLATKHNNQNQIFITLCLYHYNLDHTQVIEEQNMYLATWKRNQWTAITLIICAYEYEQRDAQTTAVIKKLLPTASQPVVWEGSLRSRNRESCI
jgi:hypothetical protein